MSGIDRERRAIDELDRLVLTFFAGVVTGVAFALLAGLVP